MSLRTLGSAAKRAALRHNGAAVTAGSTSSSFPTTSSSRRNLHALPPAPSNVAQGAMPFLSKQTVDLLWEGWQRGLLERLNAEVKKSDLETSSLVDTIIATSQKTDRIMAFNYASLALNNAFFLSNLRSPAGASQDPSDTAYLDSPPPSVPQALGHRIEQQWGSITAFKSAFSAAALGMSSSGYLWLVFDDITQSLAIVPTFGAGTVLIQQRLQKGPRELERLAAIEQKTEAQSGSSEGAAAQSMYSPSAPSAPPLTGVPGFARKPDESGQKLSPLLCLSVYEHAWLPDWGIWGKETYLTRFWECVDWTNVAARYLQLLGHQTRTHPLSALYDPQTRSQPAQPSSPAAAAPPPVSQESPQSPASPASSTESIASERQSPAPARTRY